MSRQLLLLLSLLLPSAVGASGPQSWQPLRVERLADLNVPRIAHQVWVTDGEVVVAGGHTSGFVPTATAEYYRDGQWHLVPTTYTHDHGGLMVTPAGDVLLFGGSEKELGIGQTFTVERYDPATHSFRGYGCLEQKRCFSNALPLDSGRVVVSGNWYADDSIELYDGNRQNKAVKPVAQHRSLPHILRTARDNAIIFSARDIHAGDFDTIIIDRLRGEPFTDPLFESWRPYCYPVGHHGACFIGDETKGEYVNLIQVMRGDTAMAIVRVEGESFSLLPTTAPIPMRSQWGQIYWFSHIVADTKVGRAYFEGYGEDPGDHRFYVAAIDYQQRPAPLTMYYSEPFDSAVRSQIILTPSGDLMLAGGLAEHHNNYDPVGRVYLLHVGTATQAPQAADSHAAWKIVVLALLLLATIATIAIILRRRKKLHPADDDEQAADNTLGAANDEQLMSRICQLMDEQQLYLNADLKVAHVAKLLGTNRAYISACINSQRGYSFNQLVSIYRIDYAKLLLRQHPDKKISEIATASGFNNESTFFRTFKNITGKTPKEWQQE